MKKNILLFIFLLSFFIIFIIPFLNSPDITDIDGVYNRKFKDYAVFYPQHQDDEVLWAGSAIIRALDQCGKDKVYVVLVSDGSGVNVFKDSKYKNLSRKEKQNLRDAEFKASLKDLGVKESNITLLADLDDKEGVNYELMEKIMLQFEYRFKNVTHITHHYKYDDHPMHKKNGAVLKKLKDEGLVKDDLYFIKPQYAKYIAVENRAIYTVNTQEEFNKIKLACKEYKLIDTKNKKFGIGYTSAHNAFDNLLNDPKAKSILSIK